MKHVDEEIDDLDAGKGQDEAAEAVNEQVAPQERGRADRSIGHALERKRNERDDDERDPHPEPSLGCPVSA